MNSGWQGVMSVRKEVDVIHGSDGDVLLYLKQECKILNLEFSSPAIQGVQWQILISCMKDSAILLIVAQHQCFGLTVTRYILRVKRFTCSDSEQKMTLI
jgi:hypothetical protein